MGNTKADLIKFIAGFTHNPLDFVLACFPWGEGELAMYKGPDEWQVKVLKMVEKGLLNVADVIRIAVASGNGIGKGHRYTDTVETPLGRRLWGSLKVGDYVFNANGNPTKIMQLHPYSQLEHYKVTFDDDTSCVVSGEHLWNVKNRNDRRVGNSWRTLSTLEILNEGVLRKSGHKPSGEQHWAKQWEIPIQGEVSFPHRNVSIHPYLMGIWLGDGTKDKVAYCKPYDEIREKLKTLGYDVNVSEDGQQNSIVGIKHLWTDEVFKRNSYERYIPADYKYNDVQCRRDLLCGLLDTDGEINRNGTIAYSTTSKVLADDVMWIVRSLGGKAQLQPTNKQGWYYKDGERVKCRDCYRVTITLPFNPFSIKHRKDRYKASIEHRYRTRWIASIESIGKADGMCITVENNDGLYLANDFIVTHNSALVSWLILWSVSTFEDTRGVVTANTEKQLTSKTWSELAKWYRLFIGKDLFNITATSIYSAQEDHERTWRIDAIPWSKDNPEAFAGLHNQGRRIAVFFDEASAILDEIWRVTEGAVTDANTEIIWCAFGNPTRNSGKFYDCFTSQSHIWNTMQVDSRTVKISNKSTLNAWVDEYGEDSDFVKVHVRGMFPSAGDNQLISKDLVDEAMERKADRKQYEYQPAIIGVDPAWSGNDLLAIVLRQGNYSKILRTMPKNENDMEVARMVASYQDQYSASAVFIDMGYGTGIFSAGKDMGRTNWKLVPFGSKSDKEDYANKRAEMWFEMKNWLKEGGCIDSEELAKELIGPEAHINRQGKHCLESKDDMKRRGIESPNLADALALTFAFPVKVNINLNWRKRRQNKKTTKWGQM